MTKHPCDEGCQYSKDVGMWPEHSCGNGCMYDKARPSPAADVAELCEVLCGDWFRLLREKDRREFVLTRIATAFASQADEIARLERENEDNRKGFEFHAGRAERERERAEIATSTIATMRAALEKIAACEKRHDGDVVDIARTALGRRAS